jgi:hypothetical protein
MLRKQWREMRGVYKRIRYCTTQQMKDKLDAKKSCNYVVNLEGQP